jgi:hypothetical protein
MISWDAGMPLGMEVLLIPLIPEPDSAVNPGTHDQVLWAFWATPGLFRSSDDTESIGSTGETEAADTTAVTDVYAKIVNDTRLVRMAYSHAGDQVLYAYYRTYQYKNGILYDISAESRVTIDEPEACA